MSADRFLRHRALVGENGIARLQTSTVAVCGAGGLGSTVLTLLARLGVGSLVVFDEGTLDTPDLNRQILYDAADIGAWKAARAAEHLGRIGPDLTVAGRPERITAETDFRDADLVVDCLDNFATRFAVDDATYSRGIPLVHAGVYEYFGQITSIHRDHTRSLRELFDQSAVRLDEELDKPMYPPAVVCVAAVQAAECVHILLQEEEQRLYGRLASVDLHSLEITTLPFV